MSYIFYVYSRSCLTCPKFCSCASPKCHRRENGADSRTRRPFCKRLVEAGSLGPDAEALRLVNRGRCETVQTMSLPTEGSRFCGQQVRSTGRHCYCASCGLHDRQRIAVESRNLPGLPPMNNNGAFPSPMSPLVTCKGDQPPFNADYSNCDNGLIYTSSAPDAVGAKGFEQNGL
jgi:hypothetical protein